MITTNGARASRAFAMSAATYQLALEGPAETSRAAHRELVTSGKAASDRARILTYLEATPSTCDEVCAELSMLVQTVSGALNALEKRGQITRDGSKRETRNRSLAFVWSAVRA